VKLAGLVRLGNGYRSTLSLLHSYHHVDWQ